MLNLSKIIVVVALAGWVGGSLRASGGGNGGGGGGSGTSQYIVEKEQNYYQTSGSAPAPTSLLYPAEFSAQAPTAGTVTPPGAAALNLVANSDNGDYELNQFYATKAALDTAYPNGTYTLNGAAFTPISVSLTGDVYSTVIPTVTGGGTWQNGVLQVDPAQAVTLNFNTFAGYGTVGAGGYESIQVQSDTQSDSVSLKQQYASAPVNGLTLSATPFTSYTIPAGTLHAGLVYAVTLTYANVVTLNTTQISGGTIASIYASNLKFYIGTTTSPAVIAPTIVTQPATLSVAAGSNATISIGMSSQTPVTTSYEWYFNGVPISFTGSHYTYNGASLTINDVTPADAGTYGAVAVNAGGRVGSQTATLTVQAPTSTPAFTLQPASVNAALVPGGSTVVFSALATGGASYQWQLNGQNVTQADTTGANSPRLLISGASLVNAGTYTCIASNSLGSAISLPATLTLTTTNTPGHLVNLSILSTISGGLTMGFVTGGAGTSGLESLLIRAVGPSLGLPPFGLPNILPDPTLQLVQQSGSVTLATDAGWATPAGNAALVMAAEAATGAFSLANTTTLDSALVESLPAVGGGYSVVVKSQSGVSGQAITEVYDANSSYTAASTRLVNLSCITTIPVGDSLGVGFVLGGNVDKTILVRVSGPTLATFGQGGTMTDPQLAVTPQANGTITIAANSGWGGDAVISAVAASVCAFPFTSPTSLDSAVVLTLPPGVPYTVEVNSASGGGGAVLVEIYEVP